MPRPRARACLQDGLKLDLNRLSRNGFIIAPHERSALALQLTWLAGYCLPDAELYLAECDRMRDLLRTVPSTVAGVLAMLQYLGTRDFVDLVIERGTQEDNYAAVRVLLQSLASGLERAS